MILIPLQAIPNQKLSIQLESVMYNLAFKEARGIMAADITRANIPIVTGQRVVPGYPIIPYAYLAENGNFLITTKNDEYPYYTQFGITQFLLFATAVEVELINGV